MEEKETFHNDLLQKRVIYLSGEVNIREANRIGRAILWLNARSETDSIRLYINSGGGDVEPGLDIYDIIKYSKAPVTGIVYRTAASMAAVILQACASRKMLKHAEIGVHYISVKKNIAELQDNLEKALEKSMGLQKKICDILADATRHSSDEIQSLLKRDLKMSAEEAKKLNFIDEIL